MKDKVLWTAIAMTIPLLIFLTYNLYQSPACHRLGGTMLNFQCVQIVPIEQPKF